MRRNYLWYELFRHGIVRAALNGFYSARTVSGTENIPTGRPVIFVANHQNSFLDALHIVCNTDLVIYFLTRADPFKTPLVRSFLRSLNMLPVYRVQDGFGTIKKNELIFEKCIRYLGRRDAILVFAEANHDLKRRIRPLSKGFTRFAFGAEIKHGWELDLQVIPVGINYGDHRKARGPVHVEFGKGIKVARYKGLYRKDKSEAARQLKKATSEGLKKVTMHVDNLNRYPLHRVLLDELESDRSSLLDPSIVNRRVSLIERNLDREVLEEARQLLEAAERHGVELQEFVTPDAPGLKDILLTPFYLFSLLNNLVPYLPVGWIVSHYIEDHVFDASAKFLSGLVLFPIYYLLVSVILGLNGVDAVYILAYVGLSLFTLPLFPRAKELIGRGTASGLRKKDPDLYQELKTAVRRFLDLRDSLFGGEKA